MAFYLKTTCLLHIIIFKSFRIPYDSCFCRCVTMLHNTRLFVFFQSHKDKIRQKERHKKSADDLSSPLTTSIIEKVETAKPQCGVTVVQNLTGHRLHFSCNLTQSEVPPLVLKCLVGT